jgi:hypothetical protein
MKGPLALLDENINFEGSYAYLNLAEPSPENDQKRPSDHMHLQPHGISYINSNFPRETSTQPLNANSDIITPEGTSKKVKHFNYLKKVCAKVVDSNLFIGFMTLCTIFALFANDIQAALLPSSTDNIIDNTQATLLFIFTFEIFITAFAKKDYVNSFFFWLDIIATISLIQDADWMFNSIFNR